MLKFLAVFKFLDYYNFNARIKKDLIFKQECYNSVEPPIETSMEKLKHTVE